MLGQAFTVLYQHLHESTPSRVYTAIFCVHVPIV